MKTKSILIALLAVAVLWSSAIAAQDTMMKKQAPVMKSVPMMKKAPVMKKKSASRKKPKAGSRKAKRAVYKRKAQKKIR